MKGTRCNLWTENSVIPFLHIPDSNANTCKCLRDVACVQGDIAYAKNGTPGAA